MHTFQAPNFGPLGHICNTKIEFQRSPQRLHTIHSPFHPDLNQPLPQVGIVYAHAGPDSALAVEAFAQAGYAGIVHAGFGNGNMNKDVVSTLQNAADQGVIVIRASRAQSGSVTESGEVNDRALGFIPAGLLNPQKARVLLQLALACGYNREEIWSVFQKC